MPHSKASAAALISGTLTVGFSLESDDAGSRQERKEQRTTIWELNSDCEILDFASV